MDVVEADELRATVLTPSGVVSYLDTGGVVKPTVLFVHGLGTGALLWRNLIEEVRGDYRCVAVDLPGHGGTPSSPDQDVSLRRLAEWLEEFCAALGLTDFELVGNGTGGAVAQIFAVRNPDLLNSLLLTNCPAVGNLPPRALLPMVWLAKARLLAPIARWLGRRPKRARRCLLGYGYADERSVAPETVRAYVTPLLGTRAAARNFQRMVAALDSTDLTDVAPALLAMPVWTMIIWGTEDFFYERSWSSWMADTIPSAMEIVEIRGARTFLVEEHPIVLVPYLREHWRVTRSGRSARAQTIPFVPY